MSCCLALPCSSRLLYYQIGESEPGESGEVKFEEDELLVAFALLKQAALLSTQTTK